MRIPGFLKTAGRHLFGHPARPWVAPPAPDSARHGLAVVLIAKDEERHVADWLRFYALAGARTAIIYDNGSTDATRARALSVTGIDVICVPWIVNIFIGNARLAIKRQPLAYAHAICTFGATHRWMTFVDIDEYIVPTEALTIPEVLAGFENVSNLSLPWTMFGTGGHMTPPAEPAAFAFEKRAARRLPAYTNYKCIVDPCDVIRVSTHKYTTRSMGEKTVNDRGELAADHKARRTEAFASADRLQLNHYYTFSREELDAKTRREGVSTFDLDVRGREVRRIAALIEEDTITDETARRFLARHGIETADQFRAL